LIKRIMSGAIVARISASKGFASGPPSTSTNARASPPAAALPVQQQNGRTVLGAGDMNVQTNTTGTVC
jgi:hypothetical protein